MPLQSGDHFLCCAEAKLYLNIFDPYGFLVSYMEKKEQENVLQS
jgi:hypothetical protein